MRWEQLFADLEAQARASEEAQWRGDVADRTRSERASIAWGERLLASVGRAVTVTCTDGERVSGTVIEAGSLWCLLEDGAGRSVVIPAPAVVAISGLAPSAAQARVVDSRLTFATLVRGISRDRSRVALALGSGDVQGVIAVVGADYCDVRTDVGETLTIPLARIVRCTAV
ncbi:hypothetical protein [Demequina globuliformis]|uniref:hypothetical protein n=1 Tax=Demequina globuliformis TaxID=676202 RepID=UPI000781E273|nr:hypothetical protein [Demequina globuliformis]